MENTGLGIKILARGIVMKDPRIPNVWEAWDLKEKVKEKVNGGV